MAYKIEEIPGSYLFLGEGPHWDIESQSLYFVDIYDGTVYRYDYAQNKTYNAKIEGEPVVSFIIPVEGTKDKFAVGIDRRVGIMQWDGISSKAKIEKIVFEVEKGEEHINNRFNDAKADPSGRFYGGTMRKEEMGDVFGARLGSLYHYGKGEIQKIRTNIGVSNGLTWNKEISKMYYIDSIDLNVVEFDHDLQTGNISSERQVIDFHVNGEKPNFVPDGMTIDNRGFLYVATFGGSKVIVVNPKDGTVEKEIKFPCEQITSCAFGGPNLDILFCTTSNKDGKTKPAGATFKITGLNAVGLPMNKVKL